METEYSYKMYFVEKLSGFVFLINIFLIAIYEPLGKSSVFSLYFILSALPLANYLANAFLGGRPVNKRKDGIVTEIKIKIKFIPNEGPSEERRNSSHKIS